MNRATHTFVVVCAAVTLAAADLGAQEPPRGYISINGGVNATGDPLAERGEFEVNLEQATYEARHPFRSGVLIDGGVGVRIWKGLGAGAAVSRSEKRTAATVDARIPHPFQFEALRDITGQSSPAQRSETGVHMQVHYQFPLVAGLRATLFGGPSYLRAEQDLVTGVRYDESYPYDTATFASADLGRAKGSGFGFNTGADLLWMFTSRFGTGGLIRWTRAAVDLEGAGRRVELDAGGVHAALGARVLF